MKTLYQLQALVAQLRALTTTNSISPEATFGLQADILDYISYFEQNAEALGIKKVYTSYDAMVTDTTPIGTNGKALKFGQLVSIYDSSNTSQAESGNIYAWQNDANSPWLLIGNIGSIYSLQTAIDAEIQNRQTADITLQDNINAEIDSRKASQTLIIQITLGDNNAVTTTTQYDDITTALGNGKAIFASDGTRLYRLAGQGNNQYQFLDILHDGTVYAIIVDNTNTWTYEQLYAVPSIADYATKATKEEINTLNDSIGAITAEGYKLMGVAATDTDPGTPGQKVAYFAVSEGTYTNFNLPSSVDAITLAAHEVALLLYTPATTSEKGTTVPGGWNKVTVDMTFQTQIDELNGSVGAANGIASLDENAKVPVSQIPDKAIELFFLLTVTDIAPDVTGMATGVYYFNTSDKKMYVTQGTDTIAWTEASSMLSTDKQYIDQTHNIVYRYNGTTLVALSSNSSASIYNPTVEDIPSDGGYYVLYDSDDTEHSALTSAFNNDKAVLGLIISFAISAKIWKTYQYIGKSVTESNWYDTDNWKDFGSLAAGSEPAIDIDTLVPLASGYYTLGTALSALKTYQTDNSISYAKRGLVISYSTAANVVETKQFHGDSTADFWEESLWQDFGGSSKVTTSDEPSEGGKDAFSTGGAYTNLPNKIGFTYENNVLKAHLENAAGNQIGDDADGVTIVSGGGNGQGTTVSIAFESTSVYVKAGSSFIAKACVRSLTTSSDGNSSTNSIESISVYDRTTNSLIKTFKFDKNSSDEDVYNFEMDLSSLVVSGSTNKLKFVATDDEGNTGSKNMSVTAIDLTCISSQTLNYTSSTVLQVGNQSAVSIPLYKFPNLVNSSLVCTTEMKVNGSWITIGSATVSDSYSHNISLKATDIDGNGTALSHGGYLIRTRGYNAEAGIYGNYLYSTIMCIDSDSTVPVIALRWSADDYDTNGNAIVKMYNTISVDFAVYTPSATSAALSLSMTGIEDQKSVICSRSTTYTYSKQVTGVTTDGSVTAVLTAICGSATAMTASFVVSGSVIDIAIKDGALYSMDFSGRSNGDSDKSISNGGYTMTLNGANYTSNGFGTFLGENVLAVKENVTAELDHAPFSADTLPSSGAVIQFAFAAQNVIDDDAHLMECYDASSGAGFYITGKKIGIHITNGVSHETEERSYELGTKTTVAIVVEPTSKYVTRNSTKYSFMKLYVNGDEIACIGFNTSSVSLTQKKTISIDSSKGDFYLYYIMAWNSYMEWSQAVPNYLVKLTDTESMVTEYNFEDVLQSQTADNRTDEMPQADKLLDKGMSYFIEAPYDGRSVDTFDTEKTTSDKIYVTLYYYNAEFPWRSFKAVDVLAKNQGSTSATRPVKNRAYYLSEKKGSSYTAKATKYIGNEGESISDIKTRFLSDTTISTSKVYKLISSEGTDYINMKYSNGAWAEADNGTHIEMIYPDYDSSHSMTDSEKADFELTKLLYANNLVRVEYKSFASNYINVKIDFSDAGGSNDPGSCDMMNHLYIAEYQAGNKNYCTPAQRAFESFGGKLTVTDILGNAHDLTGLHLGHSTDNHPIAYYRSLNANGTSPYFHAKGNWKEHKKAGQAVGMNDTPGYNLGCLNYGDFVEVFGNAKTDTLDDIQAELTGGTNALVGTPDTGTVYLLRQYDKSAYRFVRYKDGAWTDTTGSMSQNSDGTWNVTGDVLNPVDGFELTQYNGMDWFRGVSSEDDLMAASTNYSDWVSDLINAGSITNGATVPAWTYYFEPNVDDDQQELDYALGRKVPLMLLDFMKFMDACDYDKTDADGSITVDGTTVSGDFSNRLKKFRHEYYIHGSVESAMSYNLFTDYEAAVDMWAKNIQLLWFLEDGYSVTGGVYSDEHARKVYFNKIYDCDGVNNKDNDGGCTVPAEVDPYKLSDTESGYINPYAGEGNILFRDFYLQPSDDAQIWTSDNGATGLAIADAAASMRTVTCDVDGVTMAPFSIDGAKYFYITKRLKKWQKVVSSFDGERKYIYYSSSASDSGNYSDLYFYAVQGLGLTSCSDFIDRRWQYRDSFYGCGSFLTSYVSMRVGASAENAKIKITAAKEGYFAVGINASTTITDEIHLEAGESGELTITLAAHDVLFFFQFDKASKIDISEITVGSDATGKLSSFVLCQELILGGTGHAEASISEGQLTALTLGNMPYLQTLNVMNLSNLVTLDVSECPRLTTVEAQGTALTSCTTAKTSPITTLHLPATMVNLSLTDLPSLSYGSDNSGLTFDGLSAISKIDIEDCPNIDSVKLLTDILSTDGESLSSVRMTNISYKDDGTTMAIWYPKASGLSGVDDTGADTTYPYITGKYSLTKYTDDTLLTSWQEAFPVLTILQDQYSDYKINDLADDSECVTNLDNNTGYDYDTDYVPSGHILKIRSKAIPVVGVYDSSAGGMRATKLNLTNLTQSEDGTTLTTKFPSNTYDVYVYIPHYWYKGINDFFNQEKHTLLSSLKIAPSDTWTKKNEGTLASLLYKDASALPTVNVGDTITDDTLTSQSSCAVYRLDVEGMKQARYVGLNQSEYGAAFVDDSGKVLAFHTLAISGTTNSPIDFSNSRGDYVFRPVPDGAKYLYFTCLRSVDQTITAFSVDSADIESIEPGWVEHKSELLGLYGGSVDDLRNARSISGVMTKTGNGTQVTSTEWTYDSDGNPTNTPVGDMNYTYQDMLNLCRRRGTGYHDVSYRQGKDIAVLSYCYYGNMDDQRIYGFGNSSQYTTGSKDTIGRPDTVWNQDSGVNKILWMEGFVGCNWEVEDLVGVNISTFKKWFKEFRSSSDSVMPVDGKWHIADYLTGTERVVQGLTSSGYEIARTVHGRYCDTIASSLNNDNTDWNTRYAAAHYYTAAIGRVPGRAGRDASADGGLVCAVAFLASSYSYSDVGFRLSFEGKIVNESDLDAEAA